MNSTGTTNPLTSLFMSLGGTLDLKDLDLSTDAASGLSDFSDVLKNLVPPFGDGGLMSQARLGDAGLESGETLPLTLPPALPLTLPLGVSSEGDATLSDAFPNSVSADELIQQIESPLSVAVNLAPNPPKVVSGIDKTQLGETLPTNGLALEEEALSESLDASSTINLDQSVVPPVTQSLSNANAVAASPSLSSSLPNNGSGSLFQRTTGRTTSEALASGSGLSSESSINDLTEEGLIEDFRPVTLDADNPMSDKLMSENGVRSPQTGPASLFNSLMLDTPVSGTKTADVTLAAMTADAAQASTSVESDAYEGIDLQADETLEQKLQTQLRERLEFGQDKKEWGGALGARLMTMVADDIQQARIQLDPPELGSLEIKMQISQDQASVQVTAQNVQVKDVLDASAQRLRDAMNAQGIELAEFSVSTNADTEQQSGQQGESEQESFAGTDDDWQDSDDSNINTHEIAASNSLLDTFA
jgi:flagellar hook-length control protein FliK